VKWLFFFECGSKKERKYIYQPVEAGINTAALHTMLQKYLHPKKKSSLQEYIFQGKNKASGNYLAGTHL
jgi:hypothetical protein